MELKEVVVHEMTKASPPVTVGALTLMGVPLQTWVLVATLVYTVLQVVFLIRDKWWRDRDSDKCDKE